MAAAPTIPRDALGLGLRPAHHPYLFAHWPAVDYFEVISENFLDAAPVPRARLDAVRARYPVVLHGVGLNLLGHAPLDEWKDLRPDNEDVRLHLLHLIAAHHGELEFGSPVQPKTPEAIALHYIDNLDAKLEMLARGYEGGASVAGRIYDKVKPLNVRLVAPLRAAPET